LSGTELRKEMLIPNRQLSEAIAKYRPLEEGFHVNYEEAMK